MKKNAFRKEIAVTQAAALTLFSLAGCSAQSEPGEVSQEELAEITRQAEELGVGIHSSSAGKNETVYVLSSKGDSGRNIIVSEWLKNPNGSDEVTDVSYLENIEVVSGDAVLESNDGGAITWQSAGEDVYYRGNSDIKLPVDVEISYKLDGAAVDENQLEGASGHIELSVEYTNNMHDTVEYEGESYDVYMPFLMISGFMLDNTEAANVEVTGGTAVNDGDRIVVVGLGFPGLKESLGLDDISLEGDDGEALDDIDIPDGLTVEFDAVNYTPVTVLTAASIFDLDDLGIDGIDTDSVSGKLDEAQDGMEQLMDGAAQLHDGIATLNDGATSLNEGAEALSDGAEALNDGAQTLRDGVSELSGGAATLSSGAAELNNGAVSLRDGAGSLSNGAGTLSSGASQAASGAQSLASGASQLSSGASSVNAGAQSLASGINSANEGAAALSAGLNTLNEGIPALQAGAQQLQAGASNLSSGSAQLVAQNEALNNGAAALVTGLSDLNDGLTNGEGQVAALTNGSDAFATALGQLKSGLTNIAGNYYSNESIDSTINALAQYRNTEGVDEDAAEQIDELIAAYRALYTQYQTLYGTVCSTDPQVASVINTVGALNVSFSGDGTAENPGIRGGITALLGTISGATSQLYSGAQQLQAGIDAYTTGASVVASGAAQLSEGANALVSSLPSVAEGVGNLTSGAASLAAGTQQLADGAAALTAGTSSLANGASTLSSGASNLATGTASLSSGAASLASGASTLYSGASALADGTSTLSSGASALEGGVQTLSGGASDLAGGTATLADGAATLRDGTEELTAGAQELFDGSGELQDGIARFNDEAVEGLISAIRDNYSLLHGRIEAVKIYSKSYGSYSGAPDALECSTVFIFRHEG